MESVATGIWKLKLGSPEQFTPVSLRDTQPAVDALAAMSADGKAPFSASNISFSVRDRGCVITLPMDSDEEVYGLGLQLQSHRQTGRKRALRVNADPVGNAGDTHAPVPFYVSTKGYGVYVDTARYARFYCGTHPTLGVMDQDPLPEFDTPLGPDGYLKNRLHHPRDMMIEIPVARGVDVYLFAGPTMIEAVRRYNLFSGGGCLPPLWGLGVWYRCELHAGADEVLTMARGLRESHMPCDVLGLEPGWQTHTYPSTYVWAPDRFSVPEDFLQKTEEMGFHVNLWSHAFVHNASPIYKELRSFAGDYPALSGLVPDLSMAEPRAIFADYHDKNLVAKGISGFKLDECDNSDFKTAWSFPEHSLFPSGMDGEQMHVLLGVLYQRCINDLYQKRNKRTLGQVRSSGALASSYPFVLYSDLYDHRDFIRGLVNAGFSGLLWTPEVRDSGSVEELKRRLQSVVFSPQVLINAWYIPNPPWKQVDRAKNNADELMADYEKVESACRTLFEWRMRLVPYLYSAFARYRFDGIPPFRALVMDYPEDHHVYDIDDQYMCGESLMVAPMFTGQTERSVYFPEGRWYDFWNQAVFEGGQSHTVYADEDTIPVFVKEGSIIPLAEPIELIEADTTFVIRVYTYGDTCRPFLLYEDDGNTWDYERGQMGRVTLSWSKDEGPTVHRQGQYAKQRYLIQDWEHIT